MRKLFGIVGVVFVVGVAIVVGEGHGVLVVAGGVGVGEVLVGVGGCWAGGREVLVGVVGC